MALKRINKELQASPSADAKERDELEPPQKTRWSEEWSRRGAALASETSFSAPRARRPGLGAAPCPKLARTPGDRSRGASEKMAPGAPGTPSPRPWTPADTCAKLKPPREGRAHAPSPRDPTAVATRQTHRRTSAATRRRTVPRARSATTSSTGRRRSWAPRTAPTAAASSS